ncbi:hypothetical protein MJO28_008251 [Puccinia striiformis f. sp. tritici]|uniref:Uncharacterized protein n=1 Tax=Puccinia striiformis f. sp. tritici TaxID=168172 RepID=A0ACC0EBZ6_9BASI|nr:hypothetical protein Pst134EB_016786 [Puccinia striiformis f. sp. tritici]KAI7949430.1 hypothetical protein MJO28_008251 [Puccinia striiformis f. sp. tritici]
MAGYSDQPISAQNRYSEDEDATRTTSIGANKAVDGHARAPSTSSLSDAQDPDADAEGEPDDLDVDADGIEDDDAMDYSYEQQDIDGAHMENDGHSGQEDENDDGEDEEGDNSGEEMDLDENASSPPPSPPSRISGQPRQQGSVSSKKPLKLKLKLATQPAASRPPAKRKYVRKAPISKSPSGRSRVTNDKKSSIKRRGTDEEDDELAEDSPGFSDGDDNQAQAGAYQASNGSYGASTGDDTMPTAGQLTVRQRAKEYGEPVTELQSLPMTDSKKTKELTEADRAMEKAEKSRKRKHQNEKKLEDEKTETINRLLKGQVGKAGRGVTKTAGAAIDTSEENTNQVVKPSAPPPLPTMIRRISSIRSGEYVASLSIPSTLLKDHKNQFILSSTPPKVVYPPPVRPPPQTWKLVNGVRVN